MTVSLKALHTFGLNVFADEVVAFHSLIELQQLFLKIDPQKLNFFILGSGSNVLFTTNFQGVILLNRISGIEYKQDTNFHYLHIGGGEDWHQLVVNSIQQQIYGLENLALIPGKVGSAPIQNIGAYGVEFKDFCEYVEFFDFTTKQVLRLNQEQCQFAYRDSIFKHQYKNVCILNVGLKISKKWQANIGYAPLNQLNPKNVTAQEIFDLVCITRQKKLPDPAIIGNAGSFFKNPVVTASHLQTILAEYPDLPSYAQQDGTYKLAAGWLIDKAGLKGKTLGGAAIYPQQALVIVNNDNATAKDILALAALVIAKVFEKFQVKLQSEVRFIGATSEINPFL